MERFKTARMLTGIMILSIFGLGIAAKLVSDPHGYGGSAEAKMNFLRMIVLVVSVIQIGLAVIIRKAILNLPGASPKEARLFTAQVIINALCEAPALFGFILTFMTHNFKDYGNFAALSLIGFAFFFPRKAHWGKESF